MQPAERAILDEWLAAYEPAVTVELSQRDVIMRSSRSKRTEITACVHRTDDLVQDLDHALAKVVQLTN